MKERIEGWPNLLQAYVSLAAGRSAVLPARDLRRRLGPQLDILQALGAVEPGPPLSIVTCSACYEGHTTEVDYDPATGRSSIFCGEAGRVGVADESLATVRPNLRWLPDQLRRLLSVRPSPPYRMLIEGVAWWLGDMEVGQTQISVVLAIGLRSTVELQLLVEKLQRLPPLELGLLLVADGMVTDSVGNLTKYLPVPIEDVVSLSCGALSIDRSRLAAWVRRSHQRKALPTAAPGGRPSNKSLILTLFNERRQRGERYANKLREARAIMSEWSPRFPDIVVPSSSSIRGHLPEPK